ncbi:hypothetical protein ACVYA6_16100 [Acinetobacter baumannii]
MSLSVFNTTQYEDLKDITSKIEEQCIQILNEYGQIIFLLDTALLHKDLKDNTLLI